MNFEKNILEKIIFQINKNPTKKAFCINESNYTYRDFGKRISAIRGVIKKNHSSESLFAIEVNDDLNTNVKLIETHDLLGRKNFKSENSFLFLIFDDGRIEKQFFINK